MKRVVLNQILKPFILFAVIGLALVQGPAFILEAVAQGATPTPIPSPTVAPTSTPTSTPTTGPSPTATSPGGTSRLVDLRPTDSKIKIDAGECVEFNWRVTDCDDNNSSSPDFCLADWKIEVEGEDTELIPVSTFDTRIECPDKETKFTLIVKWQNDGQEKREERKVEIDTDGGGDGGDGVGPGVPPTPGSFIVVTPILITQPLIYIPPPTATPIAGQSRPGGPLGGITELPETGFLTTSPDINHETSPALQMAAISERFQLVAGVFPAATSILMLAAGLAVGLFLIGKHLNR